MSKAAVAESKAQRAERLKRELNPWAAYAEIERFAREGHGSIPPEWLGTYFRWWGIYHPGRWRRRGRRQRRRGQGRPVLHGAHPDPERDPALPPAPDDRRSGRAARSRDRRPHGPPEHPAPLGPGREPARHLRRAGRYRPDSLGACGDVTRNITGCPVAGVDADEIVDASPLVEAATAMLNGNPDFYNLPRKYKISITGCRVWCSYPEINDVGLTALRHPASGEVGFSLRVGGGLSTDPHLGVRLNAFVRWGQVRSVIKGVSEIFRDSEVLRQSREKARLKFLFLNHGWTAERFLGGAGAAPRLRARAGDPRRAARRRLSRPRGHPPPEAVGSLLRRARSAPRADHAGADAGCGRRWPSRHGTGELRATNMQNLLILNVPRERVAAAGAGGRGRRAPARGLALLAGHRRLHGHRVLQARAHRDEGLRPLAGRGARGAAAGLRPAPQDPRHRLPE